MDSIRRSVDISCIAARNTQLGARCSLLIMLLMAAVTGACQGNTRENFARLTENMQVQWVEGQGYRHLTAYRPADNAVGQSSGALHVYIEGDGRPWHTRHRIAADPTPRNPLALALMKRDRAPVLYLGRPCYFNDLSDRGCHPALWTLERYSLAVVDSMAVALERTLEQRGYRRVVLIGYSGGGVLATLLAHRIEGVDRLVTVAANLDVRAWTDHWGYSPLTGSLDPARVIQNSDLPQVHFAGGADTQVPPSLNRPFVERLGHSLTVVDSFDHRCCWLDAWPELLGYANSAHTGQ